MNRDIETVKITSSPSEARKYKKENIPYIVYLNGGNYSESFPNGSYCVENLEDIDEEYLDKVYRRFNNIPWDIAQTKRLLIREMTVKDVPRLYELYKDEAITRYMEPLFPNPEQEIEYTKKYIRNIYGFYGYGMWILELKKTHVIIGRAGLEYKEGFDGLELGFMIGVEYQNNGYAYEACRAILEYGINELGQKHYCAYVNENNAASVRVCDKLGFKKNRLVKLSEMNFDGLMVEKEYIQYLYSAY